MTWRQSMKSVTESYAGSGSSFWDGARRHGLRSRSLVALTDLWKWRERRRRAGSVTWTRLRENLRKHIATGIINIITFSGHKKIGI